MSEERTMSEAGPGSERTCEHLNVGMFSATCLDCGNTVLPSRERAASDTQGIDFGYPEPDDCPEHTYPGMSYGSFMQCRERIAVSIGIKLAEMDGFTSRRREFRGKPWAAVKDAIVPLLDHSDCEDNIPPEVCATVAPRLREIVAGWEDSEGPGGAPLWTGTNHEWMAPKMLGLATAMELCAAAGEPLVFC